MEIGNTSNQRTVQEQQQKNNQTNVKIVGKKKTITRKSISMGDTRNQGTPQNNKTTQLETWRSLETQETFKKTRKQQKRGTRRKKMKI